MWTECFWWLLLWKLPDLTRGGGYIYKIHTHAHVIGIYTHTCMCVYRHTYIHTCVYIHIRVCMCMHLEKQCYRVLHQKPLSLDLLWNDTWPFSLRVLINQPDYTLPLCVWLMAPAQWLTATCLPWTSSSWQWIWMWKDRIASPLVAWNGNTVSHRRA